MITIVAFVINVGLFVKAKINLQNATDSAAFAGAAVQSRQLSKIAYLNWEMRNIYKEWLYKYYVIGNLNIQDVENPNGGDNPDVMSFRLEEDINVLKLGPDRVTKDEFNIPTVCIHIAGSKTNICKRYSVPGLPEFGSSNLPGAEEASRAFLDTLISTKINDCVDRTRLNMTVANTWTYNIFSNSMGESLAGRGPAILSDRQGAWPRAVELAMRIRNLEYVMNREAISSGVCINGSSTETVNCGTSIQQISQEKKLGNERLVKAFYSGYRNLGNLTDNEMKNSFTLTELPPEKVVYENDTNASVLLIPGTNSNFRTKQWVDLKLMMVNYAIFYAALIPRADDKTSGACDISKVAIPVPGYPMGFYKNPDVITYYAVKGEAEFVGMFNPFRNPAVKMTAYSAAKPFGGRIGPMLFTENPTKSNLIGRTDNLKLRSLPYITSYDFTGTTIRGETYQDPAVPFIPGLPLPTNSTEDPGSFWLENPSSALGGKVADDQGVQFGVPNLVYDYQDPYRSTGYTLQAESIHKIKSAQGVASDQPVGLFSKEQFRKFKGNNLTTNISPTALDEEIARIKAPTSYEAANYLIPTPNDFNIANGLDSFGFINGQGDELSSGVTRYDVSIYAPLYKDNDQNDVMYQNSQQVVDAIFEFMRAQESGIGKYKKAMNKAALSIWRRANDPTRLAGGAEGSIPGYKRAAEGVSDIDLSLTNPDIEQTPKTCTSIAGQFLYFYYGGEINGPHKPDPPDPSCPKPLGDLIREYFNRGTADAGYDPTYYTMNFSWPTGTSYDEGKKFLSAYMPGPFTGVQDDGIYSAPFSGSESTNAAMRRNTYSTKFVALDSLLREGQATYNNRGFAVHSEGDVNESGGKNTSLTNFENALNPVGPNWDFTSIDY